MSNTVPFQTIQFNTLFSFYLTQILDTIRARVDLGAITMKGYTAFPKASGSLKQRYLQIVNCQHSSRHSLVGALPQWRDTVGVFNSLS